MAKRLGANKKNIGRLCSQRSTIPANLQGKIPKPSKVDTIRKGAKCFHQAMNEKNLLNQNGISQGIHVGELLNTEHKKNVSDKKRRFHLADINKYYGDLLYVILGEKKRNNWQKR